MLTQKLQPAPWLSAAQLEGLIRALDDQRFTVRAKAHEELQFLGEQARPLLQQTLQREPSLEQRRRIELLLDTLTGPHGRVRTPARRRLVRALEVLENIDNAETRRLLQELADGHPEAILTQSARAALRR